MLSKTDVASIYAEYQAKNSKKFNKLLLDNRKNGRLEEYIIDICKSLHILQWVKVKSWRIDNDFNSSIYENFRKIIKIVGRKTADDIMRNGKYQGNKQEVISLINSMTMTKSYYKRLIIEFDVDFKDEHRLVEMHLILPKLINTHFIVNNNKLYPIYQIVEASCYTSKKNDALVLKTHISPISLSHEMVDIKDVNDNLYTAKLFNVRISKSVIPIMYYLANAGMTKTLEFLHMKDIIRLDSTNTADETETTFKINNSLFIIVNSSFVNDDEFTRSIIAMMIAVCNTRTNMDNIDTVELWRKKLGMVFTTTPSLQEIKGNDVLSTFERVLDLITKSNLRLPDNAKTDTYSILRWMMTNYDPLKERDNTDLKHKRIRLAEAIVATFAKKLSESIYGLLAKRNGLTIDNIVNCLRVDPMIMMYNIIKTSRYDNNVNDMSIFNYLKYTFKGENSFSRISDEFRKIHPSHLGKIDINSSSSNDPGLTGMLCPLSDVKDQYFYNNDEDNDYIAYNNNAREEESIKDTSAKLNIIHNIFLTECIDIINSKSSKLVEPLVIVNKMKYKKYMMMVDKKKVRVTNMNLDKNKVRVL